MNFLNQVDENNISNNWLDRLNYSQAFTVCVGAGPWKEKRRHDVQMRGLELLNDKDISYFFDIKIKWFPLDWQNNLIEKAITICKTFDITWESYCQELKLKFFPRELKNIFYNDFGYKKGLKVLSLFLRDKINIQVFPMDRHVKRNLDQFDIPYDEDFIIYICGLHDIDASELNRSIFNSKSTNPDYTTYNNGA